MIRNVLFITGNEEKIRQAEMAFRDSEVHLETRDLKIPEIQSFEAETVGHFKADYAGRTLLQPVFTLDRSFHIEELKGFPGPFAVYVNQWLSAEQILAMIPADAVRTAYWTSVLSCYLPGGDTHSFISHSKGKIATHATAGGKYPLDNIFTPDGYAMTLAEMSDVEKDKFWLTPNWKELVKFLETN